MAYTLHQKFNAGGMADLWLATKEGPDGFKKVCAVKVIRSDLGDRDDFARMFLAEAKILSNMSHANIMPVMDLTTIEQSPAIVMDLNIGGDLNQIFRQSFDSGALIPIPMLLHVIASVAQGLHYAHNFKDPVTGQALAVVHRDISPGNILLAIDGKVRLSDFGIAKAQNRGFETDVGQIKGKYTYMSPEQLQNKSLDHRSDLFSLGVVLWEGLAGRFRFDQLPEVAIYEKLSHAPEFESLLELNANVSTSLNDIVIKCLKSDPSQRYRTAGDLARDLERQLITEYASFSPEKLGRFVERSLKSQVERIQQTLQQALSGVSAETPTSRIHVKMNAKLDGAAESSQNKPLKNPSAGQTSDPNAVMPQLIRQVSQPVSSSASPQTPQDVSRPAVDGRQSQVRSMVSEHDHRQINVTVNMGHHKSDDQSPFLQKGRDLTLTDASPTSIQPKITVSKTNLKAVPQNPPVTMRRGPSLQVQGKQTSGRMGFIIGLLFLMGVAWLILNAPMIRQLIKAMKAG
jgi:serine/threonine protein kinase